MLDRLIGCKSFIKQSLLAVACWRSTDHAHDPGTGESVVFGASGRVQRLVFRFGFRFGLALNDLDKKPKRHPSAAQLQYTLFFDFDDVIASDLDDGITAHQITPKPPPAPPSHTAMIGAKKAFQESTAAPFDSVRVLNRMHQAALTTGLSRSDVLNQNKCS